MPGESWQHVFSYLSMPEIFGLMDINNGIRRYAQDFLISQRTKYQSLDDLSKSAELRKIAEGNFHSQYLSAFYQGFLSGKIGSDLDVFKIEKFFKLPQANRFASTITDKKRQRLAAIQSFGLLSHIDQKELKALSPEHISYLTSKAALWGLIDLQSKGKLFNLLAFLKIPSDILNRGIQSSINDVYLFSRNSGEAVSAILNEFQTELCDLVASLNTEPLNQDQELEKRLASFNLTRYNLASLKNLVSMIQSGIFVNRIEYHRDLSMPADISGITTLYDYLLPDMSSAGKLFGAYILLAAGADPNQQNPASGNTALHNWETKKYPAFVEALLKYGANPNLLNHKGEPTGIQSITNSEGAPLAYA